MSSYQDSHKRRKLTHEESYVDTTKPSSFFQPSGGRAWTVSVAIAGSVLSTCKRDEQRNNAIGSLSRALAVFGIDEVVIFDDMPVDKRTQLVEPDSYTGETDPCGFMEHVLNYLEIPPFMRKLLMPIHPNLRGAGTLPSLDIPSHPHPQEWLPYREAVSTSAKDPRGKGTVVDIGAKHAVYIDDVVPPSTRITVKMDEHDATKAEAVHPDAPRTEGGYYWGYSVRRCNSLAGVFEECKYDGGYDLSIGTSERGVPIAKAFSEKKGEGKGKGEGVGNFNHIIIVFGGPRGLEYAAENDAALYEMGVIRGKTKDLFDHWVNILPGQASRTVRTVEAVFIGLASLRRVWENR